MKLFLYYRDNGVVCMRSEEEVDTSLNSFEYSPTPEELEKINQNYELRIENEQLIFKTPTHLQAQVKKADLEKIKEDLDNGIPTKTVLSKLLELM